MTKQTIILLCALVLLMTSNGESAAQGIVLNLDDAPLSVSKGTTVSKRIIGIPNNSPGIINIKLKWHAAALIPNTFNKLTVKLVHGLSVLDEDDCYSQHADKTPKCSLDKVISQTEANAPGDWKVRITNDSNDDVNGFNISKESSDLNPFVPNIKSTFTPDCGLRYIEFSGHEKEVDNIGSKSTVEKSFLGVTNVAGELHIRAKWHVDALTPNIFEKLRVEILHNGNVVATDEGFSIHAGKAEKIDIKMNVGFNQFGGWRVRITHNGVSAVKGFGLEKGGDLNPLVPAFRSTYKPCTQ